MQNKPTVTRLPRSLDFFDLRDNGAHASLKGHRYAGDAMGSILGVKTVSPVSVSGYSDLREDYNELPKLIQHLRRVAAEYRLDWRKAKRNPAKPGAGGGCYYLPKAIYVTNFGGSLVCDQDVSVIRGFSDEI